MWNNLFIVWWFQKKGGMQTLQVQQDNQAH